MYLLDYVPIDHVIDSYHLNDLCEEGCIGFIL